MSDNALKTATDKYRPTVTPVTSVGNKSATQTGKPIFTEGDIRVSINDAVTVTFEDRTTTKTISCLGSYKVAADGTATFTPEAEFTGPVPAVIVVHEDVNGTKDSATYPPTLYCQLGHLQIRMVRKFQEILQLMVNKQKLKFLVPQQKIANKRRKKSRVINLKRVVDENGNTQHIYKHTVTPTPESQITPQSQPEPEDTKDFVHPETGSESSDLVFVGLAILLAEMGFYT